MALFKLKIPAVLLTSNPPLKDIVDVPPIDWAPVPLKVTMSVGAQVPELEIFPPMLIAEAEFELKVVEEDAMVKVP